MVGAPRREEASRRLHGEWGEEEVVGAPPARGAIALLRPPRHRHLENEGEKRRGWGGSSQEEEGSEEEEEVAHRRRPAQPQRRLP